MTARQIPWPSPHRIRSPAPSRGAGAGIDHRARSCLQHRGGDASATDDAAALGRSALRCCHGNAQDASDINTTARASRGDYPKRYSFLEHACMSREMDRL